MANVYRVASHARIATDRDGAVVLDLRSAKYIATNRIGSAVLAGVHDGRCIDDVVFEIASRCSAPLECITTDVARFLDQLLAAGLIEPHAPGERALDDADGNLAQNPAPPQVDDTSREHSTANSTIPVTWTVLAYVVLVFVDVSLRLFGFGRLHRLLQRLPSNGTVPNHGWARGLARAVDRAAAFYVEGTWCLERSLVTLLLLRLRGWPARLVLGAKRLPFGAHAWVELDDRIINDDPSICQYYAVLYRC